MGVTSKAVWTLADTVRHYDPAHANAEIYRFRNTRSLAKAIKTAAKSIAENGKPYPHQQKNWNFWPDAIPRATEILLRHCDDFRACGGFDHVHELVTRLIAGVDGVGKLYAYDVSLRIGAFLGDEWLPKVVYLHAGALGGAKRLGLPTGKGFLDVAELPGALRALDPWRAEDILCHHNKCCRNPPTPRGGVVG